jgi:YaiO family outer membrane protein
VTPEEDRMIERERIRKFGSAGFLVFSSSGVRRFGLSAKRTRERNALLRKGTFHPRRRFFIGAREGTAEPGSEDRLARALSFSGDHAGGEREYREVLAASPGDVEARLGLADVIAWQKRYGESERVLSDLAGERPNDPEVWSRRGRVALWSGDRAGARRYFEKTLEIDRGNAEAKRGLVMLASIPTGALRREVESGVSLLRIRRANPGTQVWAAYRDRWRRGWDFLGRADYLHRFGKDEGRGTVGITRKWEGGRNLRFEGGASPGADVFSRYAIETELGWPLFPGLAGYLGGKFSHFSSADVWNGVAALEYYPLPKDALLFRFIYSGTSFENAASDRNTTWLAKVTHFFTDDDRAWIYYSRGSESYQTGTADQIGNVFADIYGAGGRYFPDPRWGLEGNLDLQRRNDGNRYLTITGIVYRRF